MTPMPPFTIEIHGSSHEQPHNYGPIFDFERLRWIDAVKTA